MTGFSADQLHVIEWAAKECRLQGSGELSVGWMLRAWNVAVRLAKLGPPTEETILRLAAIVEPVKNKHGYRQCGVRVGWDIKGPWYEVPRRMGLLIEAWHRLDATGFFREFEECHPFLDGNGRVGALLFVWRAGLLTTPVDPPNLWNDPRR